MQVEVELAEFAAVVAGADCQHAVGGSSLDRHLHRASDRGLVDTVDDDLVRTVSAFDQRALDSPA